MTPKLPRIALLAGGSGFTGSRLLRLMLQAPDYSRVYAVSRRPLPLEHPKLANRILPIEQTRAQLASLRCQDAYCCLGSTRWQAGSDAGRQKVDLDLVVSFARAAHSFGATRFVVLSAAGAGQESRHGYLRTKGELEFALRELRFDSLDILRPGLLLGWRKELRPLELVGNLVMPLLNPLLGGDQARWRGIAADDVAAAMLGASRSQRRGAQVYEGAALNALAVVGRRLTP